MLPNFIIPEAQKSGTTALRIYLAQHPEVYIVNKEIHFFNKNFDKGIEWYEQFFKAWKGEKAIGEKTPDYLYDGHTPQRIYEVTPDVKLIFVLRNPIDKAYFHYWYNVRVGLEFVRKHRILRDAIKRINTKKGKIPPMREETRKKLQEYFEPYNEELEKFTGLKLEKWRR